MWNPGAGRHVRALSRRLVLVLGDSNLDGSDFGPDGLGIEKALENNRVRVMNTLMMQRLRSREQE